MNATEQPTAAIERTDAPETRSHETIDRFRVGIADVDGDCVDGATLLDWIYRAAHRTAELWSGTRCVLASVGNLHLDRPIAVGERVEVRAGLVYTGRSSMHLLITVQSGDSARGLTDQTAQCAVIFVAVDGAGAPVEVPRWTPLTMLELQRHRQARVRARMRRRIEDAMTAHDYTQQVATRRLITTADADSDGTVPGAAVLGWIDDAACERGADWTGGRVVTSYLTAVSFHRPVRVGDMVDVSARILHTGRRSVHLGVLVSATDPVTGRRQTVARAALAVVSPDATGAARPVPPWVPRGDADHRLDEHARHLIALRAFIEPFPVATTIS